MTDKSVMIIGLGNIGSYALEFLARTPGVERIITADVAPDGLAKTNNAALGAAQMGFHPKVEFVPLDLYQVEKTAAVLDRMQPRVILSCVTLQSYWVISQLPPAVFQRLKGCGYGPWIPMHFTLNFRLMSAVKMAGLGTHVVTAAFPDATNAVLARVGLAPAVGLGNLDNFVPGLRRIVAERMRVPAGAVAIYLVGHHVLRTALKYPELIECPPFALRIFVDSRDVSAEFDGRSLLDEEVKLVAGFRNDSKVASSGVRNVLAILADSGVVGHAPGPRGLIGGYPVRLDRRGAEVVLPPGMTLEEAVDINVRGQVYDGIERIEDDGTVVLTDRAMEGMRDVLGYGHKRVRPEENEERARELQARFKEAMRPHGR